MMQPKALILHATGTNRDREAAQAIELAGGEPEIVHLNQLRSGERHLEAYQLMVIPGGFSYADALGAGKLLALDLQAYFSEAVSALIGCGKPVIGICNGFQALVKSGILPGLDLPSKRPQATLSFNEAGHFECRWVYLVVSSERCLWTRGLQELIYCPVAHGEGRFIAAAPDVLAGLEHNDQVALRYAFPDGTPADGLYPANPNGSNLDIAGVCNPAGNVLGLMPHPEDHLFPYQHPRWTRGEIGQTGLTINVNGIIIQKGCS